MLHIKQSVKHATKLLHYKEESNRKYLFSEPKSEGNYETVEP